MWTYHVTVVLSLCVCLGLGSEGGKRECESDDFLRIQKTCRAENDALLVAENEHENGRVCERLVELFYCVAGHVPFCFHDLTTIYNSYFHSPHNCLLSPQQIMSLQNLTTNAAAHQGHNKGEVDVEVDIIVPDSTPSTDVPSSEEERKEEEEGKEREGEAEGGGGGGMRHEEHSGSADGHSGSNGGTALRHCTLPLLVTSWMGAWRLTSYLLLS